ncbi:HAD family hydrolase [Enterobacter sp. CC120223-11]|uniref:HAD family hydrolase n=2 Tax=Gammaproteobacteria TaxID=1236 RepID=UPI001141A345|nr:HAD family hydrolase [Enterobacter sp. CC120223-11]
MLYPHDFHRTAKCKHVTVAGSVGVHASREHGSAFYSGLMNCSNVWTCAVCAAKVQERRRLEVAQAVEWAAAEGLQCVMVTLTFPHYVWHKLAELLEQQSVALEKLREGSPWTKFKERNGYRGLIRSLELTLGGHGWHPHTHELWVVGSHVDAEVMKETVLRRWKSSCARAGLLDLGDAAQVAAFEAHAVDIKGWCTASDYLAKQDDSRNWGVDAEIAKASTKQGRAKGKHPFGLLKLYQEGDQKAGGQFLEYAAAIHGKRQLYWSPGLKDLVGVNDLTDKEVNEEEREAADLLGLLDLADWWLIRKSPRHKAKILNLAESNGGWPAIQDFIRSLRAHQPAHEALPEP